MAGFEIFQVDGGGWRWWLLDASGETIALAARDRPAAGGCRVDVDAMRAAPAERYTVARASTGEWRWTVADDSGTAIAQSGGGYATREECEQRTLIVVVAAHGAPVTVRGEPAPGPAPAKPAPPPLDPSVGSPVPTATAFLYSGDSPVQTGVAEGAIDPERVCVLRGRVLDRDGAHPLAGVTIRVADRPELGRTLTREDGVFDLAVNGGEQIGVRYERDGLITATRVVDPPPQDFLVLPDVALVAHGPPAGQLTLGGADAQLAHAGGVADEHGARASALIAPGGAAATAIEADGRSTRQLDTLTVRATEFSVGDLGVQAMPGELPPSSGYTYAVELSVDETRGPVEFSEPFIHYVENFLGFPVGGKVPVGYYDRSQLAWVPAPDGRIVGVLDAVDGLAELDLDGSGAAADASALEELGVSEQERRHLAQAFEPGQQLWRVPIPHFSPWDYNWPFGPPDDAAKPDNPPPKDDEPDPEDCPLAGSIVDVQNRTLGEALPLAGTPYALRYRSDRVPGRRASFGVDVTLSGSALPKSVERIELEVHVAGRLYTETRQPQTGQSHRVEWDGRDPWGRSLQGQHRARVRTGYVYKAAYKEPDDFEQSFARLSGTPIEGSEAREEVTLWQESRHLLGVWNATGLGLGGWTVDVHHAYDPASGVVQLGSGGRLRLGDLGARITTVAGIVDPDAEVPEDSNRATETPFRWPATVEVDPGGGFYVAGTYDHAVRRVDPAGAAELVTLSSDGGFAGDGGPAAEAMLHDPTDLAVGPKGELYVADSSNNRIRVIAPAPARTISTFAGSGRPEFGGDGGPATAADLNDPLGVACTADGTVYIADTGNRRVRRVAPDGTIATVAGGGDDADATRALDLDVEPVGVAIGPDGALFIADPTADRVLRVAPDGAVGVFAGTGETPDEETPNGDGALATAARLGGPIDLQVAVDGTVFVACREENRVRRIGVDGVIGTVAGDGRDESDGDGGPPEPAAVSGPKDIVLTPDGGLLIADYGGDRIRRVTPALAGFKLGDQLIHSDGDLHRFDSNGRHLSTHDARTGAVQRSFAYDDGGRLAAIAESTGDTTRIERSGREVAIVGPLGHRTRVLIGADGYATAVTNPAGETTRLDYAPGGLLVAVTDAAGVARRFAYDELGRLAREDAADGTSLALAARDTPGERASVAMSGSGRESRVSIRRSPGGEVVQERACCGQQPTRTRTTAGGAVVVERPDGTVETTRSTGSPEEGYTRTTTTLTTPAGRKSVRTVETTRRGPLGAVEEETTVVDVDGRVYRSVVDLRRRTRTSTSPAGRVQRFGWDEHGRPTRIEQPGLEPASVVYDGGARTLAVGDRRATTELAPDGASGADTDAAGARTEVAYDPAVRVIERREPDGSASRFAWDGSGNLVGVTAPNGGVHAFEHTARGKLAAHRPPGAAAPVLFEHSPDGALTRVSYGSGRTVGVERDDAGMIAGIAQPAGRIVYARDAAGQLVGATTDDGQSLRRELDGPLVARESWGGTVRGAVQQVHGDDMRPIGLQVGDGAELSFEYDADGLLVQAGELAIERDPASGRVTGTTIGVVEERFDRNPYGELVDHRVLVAGEEAYRFSYERDVLGRVTTVREHHPDGDHTRAFAYDARGQLVQATIDGATERYAYDANGNRTAVERAGQRIVATYDDADRLVSFGDRPYAYADDGTLASDGVRTFDYDPLGALRSSGPGVGYVVDGLGRRVGRSRDGKLEKGFLYGGGLRPVAELDGANRVVAEFVHTVVPEYVTRDGATGRIVTDHLGSPLLVLDAASGEVLQQLRYDAFGRVLADTNLGFQPFGFAGGLYDELTGLVRFGARDYDPETGRWTAPDSPRELVHDANPYRYAAGDPVNLVDPRGTTARPCPSPRDPVWNDPPFTPNPFELHDRAAAKETALIGEHAYSGGFAHCLAACLAARWYGPISEPIIIGFDLTQLGDADVFYDMTAERLGVAAAMQVSQSCTQNCSRHFPPKGCGKGVWDYDLDVH